MPAKIAHFLCHRQMSIYVWERQSNNLWGFIWLWQPDIFIVNLTSNYMLYVKLYNHNEMLVTHIGSCVCWLSGTNFIPTAHQLSLLKLGFFGLT
jgi:hypothetical protein